MPLTLEQAVKQLTDSGIIAAGKLENFVPPKAAPKTGDELVQALVKSKYLTPFQGQNVAAGKVRALILGNYTILDRVGAGGMGQVFRAQHRRLERLVAIKMLPAAMMKDVEAVARFQREAKAAAKLRHPNIVATDDADEANGVHFLVMEHIEGQDLSALVKKNGPLPVGKAVNCVLQAAKGLEFAHSKGVIHRDIKPANLLLGSDGVVKILDMGLARIETPGGNAATEAEITGTGAVMGTVDFMSPEQALNTKLADARADIYSLGITLYYLIAGRAAYGGDSLMEKLVAHREQPLPSLQDVQANAPKQLDDIFKKMIAKRVEDRYQTMSEVVEALGALEFGDSGTSNQNEAATALTFAPAERKRLAAKGTKTSLGSLTEAVASEKTKHLFAKVIGGTFATIIAPILVTVLIKYLQIDDSSPPAAPVAAVSPVAVVKSDGPAAPKPLVAPFGGKAAQAAQAAWAKHLGTTVEQTNSVGMKLVLIPPGQFRMGSTPEQRAMLAKVAMAEDPKARRDDILKRLEPEMPQHPVAITKPFWLGMTEVTVGQYKAFADATKYVSSATQPGLAATDTLPVTNVTWSDSVQFCNWLSGREELNPCYQQEVKGVWSLLDSGSGYRLPTEAEWEYACRAGTTTIFSFGDDPAMIDNHGWCLQNSGGSVQAVGLKSANAFGVFDMQGGVSELCHDFYAVDYYTTSPSANPMGPSFGPGHVTRSGSWGTGSGGCRSASRNWVTPVYRNVKTGFRVVRVR